MGYHFGWRSFLKKMKKDSSFEKLLCCIKGIEAKYK